MHSPALKTRAIWPKNGGGKAVERKCRYQPHCMQYHGQWELSPNHLPVTQMLQLDLILKYTWKSQGPRRAEQGLKNNEVDGSALPDGSMPYPRAAGKPRHRRWPRTEPLPQGLAQHGGLRKLQPQVSSAESDHQLTPDNNCKANTV